MNRFRIEYHNGLIDIVRSEATCVKDLVITGRRNEGIASISFVQPIRKAEPSPWKPYTYKEHTLVG